MNELAILPGLKFLLIFFLLWVCIIDLFIFKSVLKVENLLVFILLHLLNFPHFPLSTVILTWIHDTIKVYLMVTPLEAKFQKNIEVFQQISWTIKTHLSQRRPLSLGNIILLKEKGGMRESFPRQVDKESRAPQGERGLEFSRRKKGQTFFLSPHSLGLYNNNVSCLRTVFGFNLLLS